MVEKLTVQIALDGGAEVEQQLADIGAAGEKAFVDIGKSAEKAGGFEAVTKSFTEVTKSIAALGSTGKEALESAAAAAQKLGASANQLAGVESVIRALAARARDSGTSFSQLAANYDAARQSAAAFGAVAAKVEQATKNTGASASEARSAVNALAQGLNAIGAGPLGRIASAIANIGTRLGTLAIAATAVGGTAAALIKFASAAEETEKALTQLQKVSGQSFESLSALASVFAKGGTPLKQFASEFGSLSEKIAAAGEQAAKQDAISKQAEDAAKGLKVTELGAITLDERVKALLETLSRAPPEEQWFRLADIFKNLGDTVERARLGKALGLSPETIASLSQGSAALKQLQAEAERLGLTLTTSNQSALQEMAAQWNQFTGLLSAFFQKIGALAAPAFTQILAAFRPVMQQIIADFQNLPLDQAISNLGTRLGPVFSALGEVLGPIVTALGTAAGTAFANAVLSSIKSGLTPTTSLWDAIFNDFIKFGESIVQNALILGQKIKQALGLGDGGGTPAPADGSAPGVTAVSSAGTAITDFVSKIGSITWDVISGAGVAAWNAITGAIQGAGTAITDFVSKIGSITWDAISGAGVAAWNAITGAIQAAIDKLLVFIGLKPSAPATGGGAPGKAAGGLLGGRGSGTSDSNLAWVSRGEHIMPARAVRQPGVLSLLEALRRSGRIPSFAEGGTVGSVSLQSFLQGIFNVTDQMAIQLARMAQDLGEAANKLKNLAIIAGGGMARGGLLGGRGSGTSDSNLAWVSRGEYITPARAVAQPGVLAFLEALRRSGGNLSRVLDGMGRFALGGMVPRAMPAFAAGGLAGGMSNVTIQFPGLPAIGGLRASSDVVEQLHKAAALAQVRSGGRKPSRYS